MSVRSAVQSHVRNSEAAMLSTPSGLSRSIYSTFINIKLEKRFSTKLRTDPLSERAYTSAASDRAALRLDLASVND